MKLYQVDSFTIKPFCGNPAGVCLLEAYPEDSLLLGIAAEMNCSETAFVVGRGPCEFVIRYFTPAMEVPLCGHATLAAAHILYGNGVVEPGSEILFRAERSDLKVRQCGDWLEMDFPASPLEPVAVDPRLAGVLGAEPLEVYRSPENWYVVRVGSEAAVRMAEPDFPAIEKEGLGDLFAVTAPGTESGTDFVVRVFCDPSCGILEDPVTGAANCLLVPYWSRVLGKRDLTSRQISRRGGDFRLSDRGGRVLISGQARTVFDIEFRLALPVS